MSSTKHSKTLPEKLKLLKSLEKTVTIAATAANADNITITAATIITTATSTASTKITPLLIEYLLEGSDCIPIQSSLHRVRLFTHRVTEFLVLIHVILWLSPLMIVVVVVVECFFTDHCIWLIWFDVFDRRVNGGCWV